MKVIKTDRLPIFSWCEDVDDGAMEQAVNAAMHPASFHHVALMPDCHRGFGVPIGSVFACRDAVIPSAVGVDIGCGMAAVGTDLTELGKDTILDIIRELKRSIPMGFNHHKEDQEWDGFDEAPDIKVVKDNISSAKRQLGTLGGGNHFLEIQEDSNGTVWLMLHSGSRNFGYKIAKEFNNIAMKKCAMWHSELPPGKGEDSLSFLPVGSKEATQYIEAMNFALRFAQENRNRMMEIFKKTVNDMTGASFKDTINIHHNFAILENHFGKNVWVHRKGATQARKGQLGIIPGSMGTQSFIVEGLGNPESFESCSHGAGRASGRAEFCRTHTVEECDDDMKDVVFDGWGKTRKGALDISEAPKAYKDIHKVIDAQNDLVKVVVTLNPLGVVKG